MGDRRPNTEWGKQQKQVGKQEVKMSFIYFLLFSYFPFNLESSEILPVLTISRFFIWFELEKKKIRDNECVKLNSYFFYKNIVDKYLYGYTYNFIIHKITRRLNMVSKLKLF